MFRATVRELRRGAAAVIVAAAVLSPAASVAGDMEIWMKSKDPHVVHFQLFSQSRNVIWPGPSDVWVLDGWNQERFAFSCQEGEKICYGAWVANTEGTEYWGAGFDGEDGCSNCCFTCEDKSYVEYELSE